MANQEIRPSSKIKPKFFYGYTIVAAAFSIRVMFRGVHHAFGVFFKPMLTEFGWTSAMTSGAFSLSMFTHGLLGIVMGRLNDRFGPRIVVTLCGLVLSLGFLLMPQVTAIWQLYLFYGIIIGTGLSGGYVPLVSTVARWFVKRRGLMTGIVVAGMGIGTTIIAPVANWLISTYDWRTAYSILGTTVLIVVIAAAQLLKRNPTQLKQIPQEKEPQLKSEVEAFPFRKAVYTKQFWMTSAIFFCLGYSMFSVVVHIVPHAIDWGLPAASAASVLATMGGVSVIGNVVLGSAADRIGSRQTFIIGFILMSTALFWLILASEAWMLYLFGAIFGFAYGGCTASESLLVARLFGLSSHGLILGVIDFGFTIGAAVGPFMMGYIFDVTGSYHLAFLVTAIICIIGMMLAGLLRIARGKRQV